MLSVPGEVFYFEQMDHTPTNKVLPAHGGDRTHAARCFGPPPPEGWLDLSTGINPHPYPISTLDPTVWAALPDPGALLALEETAARAYGAKAAGCVVAAPGTQSLIQLMPRLTEALDVRIVGPTYAEHTTSWTAAGKRVSAIKEPAVVEAGQAMVVVNPNNPDGRRWTPSTLASCQRPGGLCVVDEAFADTEMGSSLAPLVGRPGLVVLRSFGKFYGLAGLRLGFALTDPATARQLKDWLGPWAVSGPALEIGRLALSDSAWQDATRAKLSEQAARVDDILHGAGLDVIGGTSLFRLTRHEKAEELYQHLGRRGILVRAFADRPDLLRFGLPGGDAALMRLKVALHAFG